MPVRAAHRPGQPAALGAARRSASLRRRLRRCCRRSSATSRPSEFGELTDIVVLALAALSLNLLIGFTGPDLDRALGVLRHRRLHDRDPRRRPRLVARAGRSRSPRCICFVVGVLVGIPALRLKGLYLTLVTLALAQIFPALVRKFDDLTGGSHGIDGLSYDAPGWTGLDTGRRRRGEWLYWLGARHARPRLRARPQPREEPRRPGDGRGARQHARPPA